MNIIYKMNSQCNDKIGRLSRKVWRNRIEKKRLKNREFTISSQNCIGGIMYHDLNEQFLSPTVNLLFTPKEFIHFMKNVETLLTQKIVFLKSNSPYPVGKLGGLIIKFLHYTSAEEAETAWKKRTQRINWNNVFVVCCDEGLELPDLIEFSKLPYKNKVIFLGDKNKNANISCGIYCKGFGDYTDARLLNFVNPFGKRYYQKYIDYVEWLNGEK